MQRREVMELLKTCWVCQGFEWEALVANLGQLRLMDSGRCPRSEGCSSRSSEQLCQSSTWNKTDENGPLSLHLSCLFSAWPPSAAAACRTGGKRRNICSHQVNTSSLGCNNDHYNVCQMQMLNELCAPNSLTGSQRYRSAPMVTEIQMHFTRSAWRNVLC